MQEFLQMSFGINVDRFFGQLRQAQPPWSVNALAQAAGVAALGDLSHRDRTLALLRRAGEELVSKMKGLGLEPVPSAGRGVGISPVHAPPDAPQRIMRIVRCVSASSSFSAGPT